MRRLTLVSLLDLLVSHADDVACSLGKCIWKWHEKRVEMYATWIADGQLIGTEIVKLR